MVQQRGNNRINKKNSVSYLPEPEKAWNIYYRWLAVGIIGIIIILVPYKNGLWKISRCIKNSKGKYKSTEILAKSQLNYKNNIKIIRYDK